MPQPWHRSAGGTSRSARSSQPPLPQGSEDQQRPTSVDQLALEVSQAQPPSKQHVFSMGLASACLSVSADITLTISPVLRMGKKPHHQKPLVHFSLWSPHKCSSTTQCKADQDRSVISKESFMLALAEHPVIYICFSQTFLQEFALVFHLCPLQKNTLSCVFFPAKDNSA